MISIDYQIVLLGGMKVDATVTKNEDCSYTIFVNRNLCEERQRKAVLHELEHIREKDFEKSDVQEIEKFRHTG